MLENKDAGNLQTITGSTPVSSAADPALDFTPAIELYAGGEEYTEPDVAIAESSESGLANIYYVMLNSSRNKLAVQATDYPSINSAYPSAVSVSQIEIRNTTSSDFNFFTPRIACPNDPNAEDWTAVWENRDINTFPDRHSFISGITKYLNVLYPGSGPNDFYIYTDASLNSLVPSITGQLITPCFSYGDTPGNGFQIAWYAHNGLDLLDPTFPTATVIGLSAESDGMLKYNTCLSPATLCYEVASATPKPEQELPSVAGRHGDGRMDIAFFDKDYGTITQKGFGLCEIFRQGNQHHGHPSQNPKPKTLHHTDQKISLNVFPNPSSSAVFVNFQTPDVSRIYYLTLTDVVGKLVSFIKGNAALLNNAAGNEIRKLKAGIYMVTVSDDSGTHLTQKICRF